MLVVTLPEIFVATPLKHLAVSRSYEFSDGIAIREIPLINWERSIFKEGISQRELEMLAKTKYWLVAAKEYEGVDDSIREELYDAARCAAMSLQIICPTGALHVFLHFRQTPQGWDNIGSDHPKQLCSTVLGLLSKLEDQGLEQNFDAVYQGLRRANQDKLVRVQNPVLLLEHGQQIGNAPLGNLFYVMALDVLFMAGESRPFVERVAGFMGPETKLFPPGRFLHRQPETTVMHVLKDMYDLRNCIAHGQEIPQTPFRDIYILRSTNGEQIYNEPPSYVDFLLEASLFLLTGVLKKLLTEGHYDSIADPKKWKLQMNIYEHRYKDAGGTTAIKQLRQ